MDEIFLLCFFLLVASFILTYFIRLTAIRHKIIDVPNQRSSHEIPTPRGGGLAIVLCWIAGISFLYRQNIIEAGLFNAFLSGILLAVVSLTDDLFDLKPGVRIVSQFISAVMAFHFLGGIKPVVIGNFEISSIYILYPFTIIGIVWFINLFNFLDGIDGYSSLEAISAGALIAVLTQNVTGIVLAACVTGFLIWNWPKAKIFMGDIGSTQLGFILAVMAIYLHNTSELHLLQWLMITSLFWFDATLTLIRRFRNKEKLSVAHRKHAYQRIFISGFSHQKTIVFSLIINIIIFLLVFLTKLHTGLLLPAFILNMLFLYTLMKYIDKREPFI